MAVYPVADGIGLFFIIICIHHGQHHMENSGGGMKVLEIDNLSCRADLRSVGPLLDGIVDEDDCLNSQSRSYTRRDR